MGYTHYWQIPAKSLPLVQKRLPVIVEDFKRFLPHLPPLAGPLGEGEPVLGPDEVAFNGPVPDDYETFRFPGLLQGKPFLIGAYHFAFCKTERRPYDLAVQVFLLVAKAHLGKSLLLSSDGDLADWAAAVGLVEGMAKLPVALDL